MATVEQETAAGVIAERLRGRIATRAATVGLVGLGYAGLPLAIAFAEAGFPVVGVDTRPDRVEALRAGRSYLGDLPDATVAALVGAGRLTATADYAALADADAITLCLPTPLSKTKAPDPSFIVAALAALAPRLRRGQLVVLESTSYPGTTEELVRPAIEARGLVVGRDVFLAFAPERVNPGDAAFGTRNTPKLVGGCTPACRDLAVALYQTIVDEVVPVASPTVAETAKLLENTYRAVNVALANEMALICERLGIDVWDVIAAAATKPFGFQPFYPGPGLGGHCIPVVPHYLAWKLKALGYEARFIALADEVNQAMPAHVVGLAQDALNDAGRALRGARVLVLGVAYKAGVADTRESPALEVLRLLRAKGADVAYHDPLVPAVALEDGATLESVALDEAALAGADCVVVATAQPGLDWAWVARHARLLVDTRNATAAVPHPAARIVKL
ncbi:MAG TPA: nucleotide sugar dehydrogenase [Thermomicrobiales bacterium]|nr:nucleotide sugar dehydrogenase [Thermomicrobiales bacterium]